MNEKLFDIIGIDDLCGITFVRCTTFEKAKKAIKLLEANGYKDMVEIVQDKTQIDTINIDGKLIEL